MQARIRYRASASLPVRSFAERDPPGYTAPRMIQLFHVYKAYGSEPPTLKDINLNIEKGEFVFLTGPSGAGKSTLLKLVFCAEQASKGQILVGGRNIARLSDSGVPYLRRNIGV